ncbi:hypothetical protein O7632_13380 [Solwaraspora sp. WMMD406]|uniref:hypothetical protein n=1 Tax=Solwaraspora sp. WMMD406 TaxID=3016095 RepID=UPI002417CFC1|nr:hypothetical protein [Solwaraspora sp. WMMD406]MDG4765080.1 hypothetical protein [Solwaraspora sp. WMMD406]
MARELAEAITTPGPGGATFRPEHTQVLLNPHPADLLDAVRTASRDAADTLLFYYAYAGSGDRVDRFYGRVPFASSELAAESAVILDGVVEDRLAEHTPTSFVLAGSSFGEGDQLVSFTPTLVGALCDGIRDGPASLDLLTLRNAVEAAFDEAREYVEDDWVVGPARLYVRQPDLFRMVALGMNPAFGYSDRRGMLRDSAAVDQEYQW